MTDFDMNSIVVPSHVVNGIQYPVFFPKEGLEKALKYRAHDDDIVLATYPKSGTTWTQTILSNLMYFDDCQGDWAKIKDTCPFIDTAGIDMLKPGSLYKTHFAFDANTFNPNAKYIVVVRNPRDVAVSFYHHTKGMSPVPGVSKDFDWFAKYAELFVNGNVWYGDYFTHLLGWLDGTKKYGKTENVLYLVYEKMKKDPKQELLRIAKFLGGKPAELVNNEENLAKILEWSSFEYMKKEVNPQVATMVKIILNVEKPPENFDFVRKGIVGDYENHFTPEISEMFDKWIAANPRSGEVMSLFE